MAAKVRSFLTTLGIIIGIASVIIIMAIGTSAQQLIINQIRGIGSNLVGVLPGASDEKGPPAGALGIAITTLKYQDLQAILKKQNVPSLLNGAAYVNSNKTVQFQDKSKSATLTGTTASYIDVETSAVANGRFFTKEEEVDLSRVAVLGSQVSDDFFGKNLDPIGKRLKIGDQNFTVIGVLEARGSTAFSSQDSSVFVPIFTAQKIMLGIDYVNFLRLKVDDEKNISRAVADIKATLRDQHHVTDPADDDFTVRDQQAGLDAITGVTNAIKYFLTAIAAISLLVGGVGIMNTMLISVNQRIREVGLRKAIGAKNATIMFQFLVESAAITVVGGFVGIIAGALVSFLAALIMQKIGYQWPFIVTLPSVLLAFGISMVVGIFFGLYPARRAAKFNIVEALRYE